MATQPRTEGGRIPERIVVVGTVPQKRCVVFDLDGVLIDSSARLRRSLEEVGVGSMEELRDPELRRRFWDVFLSDRYIHLDTPNRRAVEALVRRREEGYGVVIITGRPYRMARSTLRQLEEFGIPYDAIVFRSDSYRGKDHEYKVTAIAELALDVAEAHDDSPDVCAAYSRVVKSVVCWRG